MEYEIRIQDPASGDSVYLIETIVECLENASSFRGIFAFASVAGVKMLVEDRDMQGLLAGGRVSLVVGIDSITNEATLKTLKAFEDDTPGFSARVFMNSSGHLFHPKLCELTYQDQSKRLIVGSGNLTPGGLRDNYEAYGIAYLTRREASKYDQVDRFLEDNQGCITPIDERALERASKNKFVGKKRRRDLEPDITELSIPDDDTEPIATGPRRVLIAQIPGGGLRWQQAHLNQVVVKKFFRLDPTRELRAFLTHVNQDGSREPEEQRPLIFSAKSNRNLKVELSAGSGLTYPSDDLKPIAVFVEKQVRQFDYMLILPDENGFEQLDHFLSINQSVGRGVRRVLTDEKTLKETWSDCALL